MERRPYYNRDYNRGLQEPKTCGNWLQTCTDCVSNPFSQVGHVNCSGVSCSMANFHIGRSPEYQVGRDSPRSSTKKIVSGPLGLAPIVAPLMPPANNSLLVLSP